ncbi:MAG: helix-turn-helix domain-containing protein [Fulvivirga sp.]|uniref:helix-turn-helix domain-containing protein n=1 Tax=Fulvivirga sp. TaxID=1931237 RepID=UPI0032EB90FD
MQVNLTGILLILTALNSFIFAIISCFQIRLGKGNCCIPILLVLISFMFFDEFSRWTEDFFTTYPEITFVFTFSWFLFLPVFYLFVRSLFSKKLHWYDLFHLIPLLLANTLQTNMFSMPTEKKVSTLALYLNQPEPHLSKIIFAIQIITYMVLIIMILKSRYSLSIKELASSLSLWLKSFYLILVIYLIATICVIAAEELYDTYLLWLDIGKSYLFIIPVYGWILYIIFKPQSLNFPVKNIRIWTERWPLDQLTSELKGVIDTIKERKLHTKNGLQVPELAIELKMNARELAQQVKSEMGLTILQLITLLRIQEMESLYFEMKHKNYTLLGLAKEVGFYSKATLYRSFKEFTGYAPSEYFENLKSPRNKGD